MVAISAEKTNAIQAIFSRSKAVIGVIHCDPFPGSPKYRGKSVSDIVERALRDAENYISGGVHGLIIENHGDIPFSKPEDIGHETSALMAVITEKVRERFAVPLGINVLANAAIPAMAIALAGGADFVRVNQWANAYIANEGFIAVWLYGEPGTGRMTGARYLHQLGRHAEGPFIACELTPANAHTLNELIAQAQGGTLVLSHPEHLTHEQQHQLVQLQSHEKRPFRLIGIGSASLVELAASSQIVAELYYCFAMTQIGCQPLSKRPDDIEPLFHHYLQKTCQRLNHPVPEVDAGLLKGMMRRVWPNNVRELANAAELFAVGVLPLAETVNPLMHIGEPTPLDQRVEDVERQIITEALNIHQGRINEVAEYLLIPRKKLYLRMKKYGLNKEHYKGV